MFDNLEFYNKHSQSTKPTEESPTVSDPHDEVPENPENDDTISVPKKLKIKRNAHRADGSPVEAAGTSYGEEDIYIAGWEAIRKRQPRDPDEQTYEEWENDKSNRYFAFKPKGEYKGKDSPAGITPTHRGLQAIIMELRAFKCRIDGRLFSVRFNTCEKEKPLTADSSINRTYRQCDLWTDEVIESSETALAGRSLGVEIGVTSLVRSDRRRIDLQKNNVPLIELYPVRDLAKEANAEALEECLLEQVDSGNLVGRWILSPSGAKAKVVALSDFRALVRARQVELHADISQLDFGLAEALQNHEIQSPLEEKARRATVQQKIDDLEQLKERGAKIAGRYSVIDNDPAWLSLVESTIIPNLLLLRPRYKPSYCINETKKAVREIVRPRSSGMIGLISLIYRAFFEIEEAENDKSSPSLRKVAELNYAINSQKNKLAAAERSYSQIDYLEEHGVTDIWLPDRWEPWTAVQFEYDGSKTLLGRHKPKPRPSTD